MNNALGRVPSQYVVLHGICKDASQTDSLCTHHQIQEYLHGAPQPVDPPLTHLCCPEFAPELGSLSPLIPGWLQDKAETVSYLITKGNFTPLEGVCSVSGIPASSQFNPSLPSMPDHSSVTNYHCWTVVIRIFLLFLSLLEVFRPSQKFWGRLSWELELLWAIGRWLIQRHVLVLAQCPYFSGELSPCWLSKSDASRSSRSGFWQSATAFLTTSNLFSLWDQSWAILTTGAPMFVCLFKKAVSCPHLYTNQLLKCFCLLPCVLSLSPCSLQHLPVTPLPSVFFFLCYHVLFVFFCFNFCLSICGLSFQLQSKAVRGRSLIFAYLTQK